MKQLLYTCCILVFGAYNLQANKSSIKSSIAKNIHNTYLFNDQKEQSNINDLLLDGNTPLMLLAVEGPTDRTQAKKLVKELVALGARLNIQDEAGNTALMLALRNGRYAVADALVDAGAKLDIKNNRGRTALHLVGERNEKLLNKMQRRCAQSDSCTIL